MQTGDVCWAHGGYPDGVNDITMDREGILRIPSPSEIIIVDKFYREEPTKIVTPVAQTSHPMNRQHKLIMATHDHINKRIKDFRCMSGIWRYGW